MHDAVKSGNIKIVDILIKSGADVGTDIVSFYYVNNSVSTLYMLYIFVSCCFLQNKWTPLHVAAKNGHLAVVEALVKSGAVLGIDMVVSMYMSLLWWIKIHT